MHEHHHSEEKTLFEKLFNMEPPMELLTRRIRYYYAKKYLPKKSEGTILDLGCGLRALFLREVRFRRKIGIENDRADFTYQPAPNMTLLHGDVTKKFPVDSSSVDYVTTIAVVEHIDQKDLPGMFKEIYRVLKKGGRFVMTAPTPRSVAPLRFFSQFHLINLEELHEHKDTYNPLVVVRILRELGFHDVTLRYFEFKMNSLITAVK